MSYSLAISLGHNSSAVLIQDGVVLGGYEEERFNEVKSSSAFPINAIGALMQRFNLPSDTDVYVGHWFIDAELPSPNKYWDPAIIKSLFPNGEIHSLSKEFTHHDSHLESAMVFAGSDFADSYTAIVADGFGSFGECLSIYRCQGSSYTMIHRVWGFEKSLGLLYQYATAFMGMKMHNHEYKMLAYEVHIGEVVSSAQQAILDDIAQQHAKMLLKQMYSHNVSSQYDPVSNIEALPMIQMYINDLLVRMLKAINMADCSERSRRIIVSYYVQSVVEMVILELVSLTSADNLLVVGGLFYNVKLNHMLANRISGKFCAMPLAGDQGAALGVYNHYKGDLKWPDHLYWGHRDLSVEGFEHIPGLIVVDSEDEAQVLIEHNLKAYGWVNLVRGAMEYGPRALCHTSTIALPNTQVAQDINRANARTMEMPFAPVMTYDQARHHFMDVDKVHKSLEYMIMARQFKTGQHVLVAGAAHHYPGPNVYTGRPQITKDPMMVSLLNSFGTLINTSFNFHGVPIVNTMQQIAKSHSQQRATAPDLEPTTIVVRSGK